MARSASRVADRTVHVHGSEVSTDGDSLWWYAEGIALVVAIVATLAAIWMAAMPSEGADIAKPAPPVPADGYVIVTPDGTIQQPETDGPQEVAVVVPGGGATGTFGDPFGTGLGDATE